MGFFYCYILQSLRDGRFYIGYSSDIHRRLKDHNTGKVVSTKSRRPLDLIHYEAYRHQKDALRRERYFKTAKGKNVIRQMLREFLKQKNQH